VLNLIIFTNFQKVFILQPNLKKVAKEGKGKGKKRGYKEKKKIRDKR